MAVTITAPQSRVVARGAVTLSWTNQYPQTAYEIMYRKASDTAWSTFGKVTSTATSVTMDLSKFTDFEEYHYRVVLHSTNATSGTTIYNGTDSSAAYSLVVVPADRVGTAKISYGSGMVEVPIYKTVTGRDSIKVTLDGSAKTYGQIAVGPTTSPIATELHTNLGDGTRAALGSVPKFLDSGVGAERYLTVDTQNSSNYTYYTQFGPTSYYAGSQSNGYNTNGNYYYLGTTTTGTYSYSTKSENMGSTASGTYTKVYNSTYYKGSTTNYAYKYDKTYYAGSISTGGSTSAYGYYYSNHAVPSGYANISYVTMSGSNGSAKMSSPQYRHTTTYWIYTDISYKTPLLYHNENGCYYSYYAYIITTISFAYTYFQYYYGGYYVNGNVAANDYPYYYHSLITPYYYTAYKTINGGYVYRSLKCGYYYSSASYKYYYGYYKYSYVSSYTRYYGYYYYTYANYKTYYRYYYYSYANYKSYYGYYYYYTRAYKYYYGYYYYYSGPTSGTKYSYTRAYVQ